MKHAIHHIWRVPAYLPYIQPDLSDKVVLQTEALIGYRLPLEYIDLLRSQNGAYTRWSLPGQVHDIIRGIGPHYPALEAWDWSSYGEWLPMSVDDAQKLIPFDGDGHWMLCFDYRNSSIAPSITLVDTESPSEELIAGSFADYLRLLEPEVDESTLIIPENIDIEEFKNKLANSFSLKIDPPSDWAHGYPIHSMLRPGKEYPEGVAISPNLVPRGFVRADDPRFEELRHLLPGMAKRYPGVSADAWLLAASESIFPELVAFLESNGIAPVYLTDCHGLSLFEDA